MNATGAARLLVLAAFVLPAQATDGARVVCAFRRLTGRPCPACGLTRSWQALAHGRLREGIGHHPLGPLAFAGAGWVALDDRSEARLARIDQRWLAAVGALWTAVWLWRVSRPPR